jgi:peptidoglycan/xylan/chitin deacetylase (PgdA/CDA1 family)
MATGMTSQKSKVLDLLLHALLSAGVVKLTQKNNPKVLTVLNYHRIADITNAGFDTFKPNVSATPEAFAGQMNYVKAHYSVVDNNRVLKWLRGEIELPPNPALITFDDGYFDNMSNAYPILKDRGLSATIFLASAYMGSKKFFLWDLAAYCFYHTKRDSVLMPSGDHQGWVDMKSLDKVVNKWVGFVKYFNESKKWECVEKLSIDLDVAIPENVFAGLYLSWDQVRELRGDIIEFGAHTVSHPILSKISIQEAENELVESKKHIEHEIGTAVRTFAYPNGGRSDFSPEVVELVKKTGYEMAFSLMPGPASYKEIKRDRFTIRRIFIGNSDTLPRFAVKLIGGEKIKETLQTFIKN